MDKKKKIIVSTYCERDSYGSIFQALALKSVIETFNCDSAILKIGKFDDKLRFNFPKSLGRLAIELNKLFRKKQILSRYQTTKDFIDEYIDIITYDSYEEVVANPPVADVYLAGSDQIWHPDLCSKLFFLDFVADHKKKVSYAASMGKTHIPSQNKELFCRLLNNFDCYSVREKDVAEIIEEYTGKPAKVHIDPTFLCKKEFWQAHEKEYRLKKPYILLYPIYWRKGLNAELKKLHDSTGLDIVVVCNEWSRIYANKYLYDVGPGEFLNLIANAEAVVTSSFHGVALSTIYKKKVAIVTNPMLPSRIDNLVNTLSLARVDIAKVLDYDLSIYDQVKKNINSERERSLDYLSEVLTDSE